MVSVQEFEQWALSLDSTDQHPHFEKISFRVKKKIFATLDKGKSRGVVKLTLNDQDVFCSIKNASVNPVNGAWGKKGWTTINLKLVGKKLCKELISVAYETVRKK